MVRRLTDKAILAQLPAARRCTAELEKQPWWPRQVSFDFDQDAVRLVLRSGVQWIIPRRSFPQLRYTTGKELGNVGIEGEAIRWNMLDLDVSILGIAEQTLGPGFFARVSGRIRGSVTSNAKAAAARRNGAKGGRPRKRKTT